MPRLHGTLCERDQPFYDTCRLEPGQEVRLFGRYNVGYMHFTNIQVSGQLAADQTYVLRSIAARCIGRTREEEVALLDHILITLTVNDCPEHVAIGPQLSMLRDIFSAEELDEMQTVIDEGKLPVRRLGYHLDPPSIIPVRVNVGVTVEAAPTLPHAVDLRVYLFGKQRRDVA